MTRWLSISLAASALAARTAPPWEVDRRDPLVRPLLDRLASEGGVERVAAVDHPVALHATADARGAPMLFVSCFVANRVLVSTPAASGFAVFAAEGPHCVGDGGGGLGGARCGTLDGPWGLASHAAWRRLYVASFGSDQVLVFSTDRRRGGGFGAVLDVLGGPGLLASPEGLALDAASSPGARARLFVASFLDSRVVEFDLAAHAAEHARAKRARARFCLLYTSPSPRD